MDRKNVEPNKIMYWKNIHGWFTFYKLYDKMVNKYDNALFVEIGTWRGKSAVYMAEKIKESGKNIVFDTIDLFQPTKYNDHAPYFDTNDFLPIVKKNIGPVKEFVNLVKGDSHEIVNQYADESIDFLFLDGNHKRKHVLKDLKLWYTKVKYGGVIAGHDADKKGVMNAAIQFFTHKPGLKIIEGNCWYYEKNELWTKKY